METSLARTEQTYLRLIFGSVGALVLFILLCWGGFRFYRGWQEGHLVRRGAAFMSGGDLKAASLSAQRALQLNAENVEALRLLAQIAEKTGDRAALESRRKVHELRPGSAEDALALARCAMWFNELSAAEKALGRIDEAGRQRPEFHAASGRLAEMRKDIVASEAHWTRASELAPNDSSYRFQLALVRLSLTDAAKREQARVILDQLRGDPTQRAAATRALVIDGIAHRRDPREMLALARELAGSADAMFSDRVMYLEMLRQMREPAYEEYLARLQAEAPAKPAHLAALLSWMIRNGMNAAAIEFAKSLPAETVAKWPAPMAVAEAHAQLKDWVQLEKFLRAHTWPAFEFLRRAYLARALRGQEKQLAAEQEFNAAQKEVSAEPQLLSMLTQTIADWGWQNEAVELLWVLTKNPDTRLQALQTLYQHYGKIADTPGLYRTLSKFAELNPHDMALQNNLAQVSLLLGVDVDHARKLAADLAAKEPTNPAYLSTYAYSLLARGDVPGALKVMNRLTESELRDPSVATYYGIILAAGGQKEKARGFLRRAVEANLLPEEKALVAKAESGLN